MKVVLLLAVASALLAVLIARVGDRATNHFDRHEAFRQFVLAEEGTHGLLAAAVCLPLFWGRRRILLLLIPLVLATAIDLDHYFVAQERVQTLTSDEMPTDTIELLSHGARSPIHSLTFALAAALLCLALSGRLDWAWVVLAALASHLIRDARFAPVTFWWPAAGAYVIDRHVYLLYEAGLGLLSAAVLLVHQPVNQALRRAIVASAGVLLPRHSPPDWLGGGPVAPVPARHHSRSSSRGHSGGGSSSRSRHRTSGASRHGAGDAAHGADRHTSHSHSHSDHRSSRDRDASRHRRRHPRSEHRSDH